VTDDEIEIQARECYAHIDRIRQEYQRAIQPYMDHLIRLESERLRPIMVRRDQMDGGSLSALERNQKDNP